MACEQIFKRELKNVSKRDVSYKCDVEIFDSSLDPDVKIEAIPDFLEFRPGEKQKFNLHVKLLPRPGPNSLVSAMIKWLPSTGGQPVCSPIHLYHHSAFDKFTWYGD